MQYEQAFYFITNKLEHELPSWLSYHCPAHTKGVIDDAVHLAAEENVTGDDLVLLKTAALFHDAGFLINHKNHEELSCSIAREYLPGFGYTASQIGRICSMIMATKLPQKPQDQLEKLICDADLYYLGTDKYAENTGYLFKEFKKTGVVKTEADWEQKQIAFLSSHHYFTQTAISEREAYKQQNLEALKSASAINMTQHKAARIREIIQDTISIIAGVLISGFALKCFLVPNHFFDGGITGISLLLHELFQFNLAATIIILNIPLIVISFFSVSRTFAIRTFASILLLGICIIYIPEAKLTSDKLLVAIFGGAFLGIGIGLIMRAGAALDGIEVLALYTLKRTSFTIIEIILAINIVIFAVAAFQFGIEASLYSILTYLAATRCIDYVVEGIQAFTGVTIISGKSEEIKYELVNRLGRGITVYKGQRGFLPGQFEVSSDCDIIFTVITRLELRKLKNLVYDVDPTAFVFANTIKEASGGVIKRRRHSH